MTMLVFSEVMLVRCVAVNSHAMCVFFVECEDVRVVHVFVHVEV